MTRLSRLLFALLVALLLALGVSFFIPAAYQPTAGLHPASNLLLQSTGGLAEQPETLILGTVITLLMLGIMAIAVLMGMQKRGRLGTVGRWIIAGFIGYTLIFLALIFTYSQYTEGHPTGYFGGFPTPTAWMIYGVWLFPLLLVFLFMRSFDRWVMTPEDLDRFHALVRENQAPEEEGA